MTVVEGYWKYIFLNFTSESLNLVSDRALRRLFVEGPNFALWYQFEISKFI